METTVRVGIDSPVAPAVDRGSAGAPFRLLSHFPGAYQMGDV